MFGARIISVLGPLLAFGSLAWLFKSPQYFYYLLLASLIIIGVSLWSLFATSQSDKSFKERFVYLIFSFLMLLSSQALFVMMEDFWFGGIIPK